MKKCHRVALRLGALLLIAASGSAQAICYVKAGAGGSNQGTSWADAYPDLQTALRSTACAEVWVAAGTYAPGAARTDSFVIRPGSAVYGGFAGGETQRGTRNPTANPTVLSGDIGVAGDNADNSYHVVTMNGTTAAGTIDANTVLDGFTIRDGNASGGFPDTIGAGLYCNGNVAGRSCSPTLSRLRFVANAAGYGGAIALRADGAGSASPNFSDVVFSGNSAIRYGGAIYVWAELNGVVSPRIERATFSGNKADRGGAIYNSSGGQGGTANATIVNTTFQGNDASIGSSVGNGGAIYNAGVGGISAMKLTNVTFNGNTANGANHFGGAMANEGAGATPVIVNAIFWGDQASALPEFLNTGGAQPTISSSLVQGGCPAGATCTNVRDLDPLLGALAANGGFGQTLLPATGSPAIDTGDAASCPATDQRGVPRPQGAHCDIGAVEVVPPHRCYVNGAATGANDGFTWAGAYIDLQSALREPTCNEVWVAQGVYKPTSSTTDRAATFSIRPGLKVYGGFVGNETSAGQADPGAHRTVLSGDIDGNDTVDVDGIVRDANQIAGSNSGTVVLMDGTTAAGPIGNDTVLDGFAITGGTGSAFPNWSASAAGGLYCGGQGEGHACSPTLARLWFSGNRAGWAGALAVDAYLGGSADAIVRGSLFSGNRATSGGGAVVVLGSSHATLTQSTFSGNAAGWGSAVQVEGGNPRIAQSTFSNNVASDANYKSTVFISSGAPTLDQVILWANTGGNFFRYTGSATVSNSIVQDGCATGITCSGLVSGNPLLGPLQDNGGATMTMLPGVGSSALDAGDPATCGTAPYDVDQRGVARPQGPACDLGAVEVREAQLAVGVSGPGSVSASGTPSTSSGIAGCTEQGGQCSADYVIEPVAASVVLTLSPAPHAHPDSVSDTCGAGGVSIGVLSGSTYAITPITAGCTATAIFALDTHVVSGTVSGLAGSGLVLQLDGGESLPIATDGAFAFASALTFGSAYEVTIASQPTQSSQTCTVANGSGTIGDADVTGIQVSCVTNTYPVGGTVSGLLGSGLALQLGGETLSITGNGAFVFPTAIASGAAYDVTIAAAPSQPTQVCTVANGSGTVGDANVVEVAVTCQVPVPHLVLTVDNGRDHLRYGKIVDYVVTLRNDGEGAATGVAVGSVLSAAFDTAFTQWQCFGAGGGAGCTASGTGALTDTVTLPPDRSVSWLVSAPVRPDAPDPDASFAVTVAGATPETVTDTDILVLLRDGFDVPYADGATVVEPDSTAILDGDASRAFALPPPSGRLIDDVLTLRTKSDEVRVQRVALGRTAASVRLLRRAADHTERATAWVDVDAGARLTIGSVEAEGTRWLLLEGARMPLSLAVDAH